MRIQNPTVSAQRKMMLALLVVTPAVKAQLVISPPPPVFPVVENSRSNGGNIISTSVAGLQSAFLKTGPLAKWGPVNVRSSITYRLLYSDGLLNPEQLESNESTIQSIAAGVSFEIGKHWNADYTMTKTIYSNELFKDTLDHGLSLSGHIEGDAWGLGITQTYTSNSPILVETGGQSHQTSYSTMVSGSYELGYRTLVDLSVTRSSRVANSNIENPQWTDADWYSWIVSSGVNYRITQRLQAGAGISMTFDRLSTGSDMVSTQPHLQMTWRPTSKIAMSGQVGAETRKFEEGTVDNLENPVYSASISYLPLEVTSLSLAASQSVTASYFANQASKNTSISLNLSQRFLQRVYLSLGASRGTTTYIATSTSFVAGRSDRFTSYNSRLSTVIFRRGSVAFFIDTSRNNTNTSEFGYSSRQYGMELAYRF